MLLVSAGPERCTGASVARRPPRCCSHAEPEGWGAAVTAVPSHGSSLGPFSVGRSLAQRMMLSRTVLCADLGSPSKVLPASRPGPGDLEGPGAGPLRPLRGTDPKQKLLAVLALDDEAPRPGERGTPATNSR